MTKNVLYSAPHFFRSFWPSIRCVPPMTFLRLLLPTLLPFSVVHAAPNELHAFFEEHCVDCHDSRSEEHTSELQSRQYLVCRLLLEKKKLVKYKKLKNPLHHSCW